MASIVMGASAVPASAAPPAATATVCFKTSFTLYSQTYWGTYNRTVRVDAWVGEAAQITTVTPGTNGCLTIPLVAGYYWRFRVFHYEGGRYYVGQSGWQHMTAGSSHHFGTVYV